MIFKHKKNLKEAHSCGKKVLEVEDLQMVKKELTFMGFGLRMRLATVTLYTSRLANSQVVKNCKKKKKRSHE